MLAHPPASKAGPAGYFRFFLTRFFARTPAFFTAFFVAGFFFDGFLVTAFFAASFFAVFFAAAFFFALLFAFFTARADLRADFFPGAFLAETGFFPTFASPAHTSATEGTEGAEPAEVPVSVFSVDFGELPAFAAEAASAE